MRRPAIAPGLLPWLVWGVAALSFSYAFFQRVAPSVMIDQLMVELAVSAAMLGNLSAVYFYAYAGLQLPVGMLVDRWGPRRTLAVAIAVGAAGSLLMGLSQTPALIYLGRLMVGAGAAFSFVGCLKVATNWLPARRFALLSGLTMMMGMAGGVGGQAPLALVVDSAGWRAALIGAGIFAALLAVTVILIVRDRPPGTPEPAAPQSTGGMLTGLARVARRYDNWLLTVFAASMTAPMLAFGGLWGVSWLMQVHGLARPGAAAMTSLMLVGFAVGAPLSGWLSDRIGRRKPPMVGAALLCLPALLLLLYLPPGTPWLLGTTILVIGMLLGCMVLAFPMIGERNPGGVSGTAFAFCNMFVTGTGALFQPLIGILLDLGWDGTLYNGVPLYDAATYGQAFLVLPAFLAVGLVLSLGVKERTGTAFR